MSMTDTLLGRIATGLILDMDMQARDLISTEAEAKLWEKLSAGFDWKKLALGSMESLNMNISYIVDTAHEINRSKDAER